MTDTLPGFHIQVAVTANPPRGMSLIERFVRRLGPLHRTEKACDVLNVILCISALVYVVTWSAVFGVTIRDTPGITAAHVVILSMAWTPLLACTVFLGAVRYACLTVKLKEVRAMADATEQSFHEAVAMAVTSAVQRFHESGGIGSAPLPKKPTLQ